MNKRGPLPRPCHATIAMPLRFAPSPCACEASLQWRPRPACAQPVKARGRARSHLAVATRAACEGAQPPDTLGPVALARVGGAAGELLAHQFGPLAGCQLLADTRARLGARCSTSRPGRSRGFQPTAPLGPPLIHGSRSGGGRVNGSTVHAGHPCDVSIQPG